MRRAIYRIYLQPAFLICAAVLAMAGSGMSFAIKGFGLYLRKEPLPLKKPLDLLDENGLAPYEVVSKDKIDNEQVLKELGTEDYIQWHLKDADVSANSSVRYCSLFITYYALPDRVPHVPEECYTGSGYQRLSSDSVILRINEDGIEKEIPARCLVFATIDSGLWAGGAKFPVLYFFKINEDYGNSREDVRLAFNKNIYGKHSYFCKVEWKFFNRKFGTLIYPTKEKTIKASRKLLSVILPILEKEHWPVSDG